MAVFMPENMQLLKCFRNSEKVRIRDWVKSYRHITPMSLRKQRRAQETCAKITVRVCPMKQKNIANYKKSKFKINKCF